MIVQKTIRMALTVMMLKLEQKRVGGIRLAFSP